MGIDFLGHLRDDCNAITAAARQGPLDASVAGCPGWALGRLVGHVGWVHRWAAVAARTGAEPDRSAIEAPPRGPEVIEWYDQATTPLLEALAVPTPPGRWNFLGDPDPSGTFWVRRQAVETAIHRWDAQAAVNGPDAADPVATDLAVSGIDEALDLWGPRRIAEHVAELPGSVHLHCTDTDGEWTLSVDGGAFAVDRGHAKGDAALRGPASTLLLAIWRRVGPGDAGSEAFGDRAVLDAWLAAL
jgi:uncharacterized protein (TIGR03083 family)